MSYAEIVLATVPAAPPTEKNQRATSCPPPISANVPYRVASRFSASAFCRVVEGGLSIAVPLSLLPGGSDAPLPARSGDPPPGEVALSGPLRSHLHRLGGPVDLAPRPRATAARAKP